VSALASVFVCPCAATICCWSAVISASISFSLAWRVDAVSSARILVGAQKVASVARMRNGAIFCAADVERMRVW